MSDYIRREDVIKIMLEEGLLFNTRGDSEGAADIVRQIPAADVKPVIMGKWKEFDESTWECANCGQLWSLDNGTPKDNNMNFCPNCGADCRGADHD